jgi:BolA family transcriptional regulator, general stress-responsive regulator
VSKERLQRIRERLESALRPTYCEVIDESHLHRGHAGARDGRGHFRVKIASPDFAGHTRLESHRLVYAAVGDLMISDIHALAVELRDPAGPR